MFTAGIDVGSLWTKVVILENNQVSAYSIGRTGMKMVAAAETGLKDALAKRGLLWSDIHAIVATGYGRVNLSWATKRVTEITCAAKGIHWLLPSVRTLIDVGGQDSKAIRVGTEGEVLDFAMNDKCAAGTGRFLEVMAGAIGVELEDIGSVASKATDNARISSVCTVFAESEIISLVAQGIPVPNIVAGIFDSISDRVFGLATRVGLVRDYAMAGGVAKNIGVVRALENKMGGKLLVPEEPRIVVALGAALIASSL